VPEGTSTAQRLQVLELSGILFQAGSTLPAISPVTASPEDHLISDLASEDRDVDYLP
jgi:hypothetical protein